MTYKEDFDEIFKEHVVDEYHIFTTGCSQRVEILRFKKPGTVLRMIKYIMMNGRLFVCGDYGEAVYCWSESKDLSWVSGLDLSYFHGKCQASPVGREFVTWDSEEALEQAKRVIEQTQEEDEDDLWEIFEEGGGREAADREYDWAQWLSTDTGRICFGEDSWEYSNLGKIIDPWCKTHFEGLKRAIAILKEDGRLKGEVDIDKD